MVRSMGADSPSPKMPLDHPSTIPGFTYRELVKRLDEDAEDLSDWEVEFVADAVDHPEKFRTQVQLKKIVDLFEKRLG